MERALFNVLEFQKYAEYKKGIEAVAKMLNVTPQRLGLLSFEEWDKQERKNLKIN